MKRLLSFILFFTMLSVFAAAQTVQGTIKAGSQPNSVFIAIKPSIAIAASKISTFYFAIAVPAAATPRPSVSIINNFNPAISYTIQTTDPANSNNLVENIAGVNYHVYNFLGDGAQTNGLERDLPASDINMVEVAFSGGPVGTSEVKIVSLKDGGLTSNTFFNIFNKGSDITNITAMFFGGTPVNNGGFDQTSFTGVGNISLPVKFLSFFALKSGDDAKLNWTVENDTENRFFELERSTDGRSFSSFAKIDALGNGKTVNTYSSSDLQLSKMGSKSIYYRVKQVDKDGTTTYSSIRTVGIDRIGVAVNLYPNPARSLTKLVFDAEKPGRGNVLIRDMNGKLVNQIATKFVAGINQQELNVGSLPAGEYNISITGTGYNQVVKLTKIY